MIARSRHSAWCAVALAVVFIPAEVAGAEMEPLKVVERASSDTVTDIGAKGDSVGDILSS